MTSKSFITEVEKRKERIVKGLQPASKKLTESVKPSFTKNPFQLGVASGDPYPDGVVLWTRLAPEPLAEDGRGGMPDMEIPVEWEVSEDQNFHYVVKHGVAVASPELGHSVHVELEGLEPSKHYYYRFKAGGHVSPVGRTKTAPAEDADLSSLSFAVASCQAWYHGYYTAYKHMTDDDLDFVLFLGDYIYEYAINASNLFRPVKLSNAHNTKVVTLDQYRLRYSLFKSDPDLQAAHAAFPWIITWDDHEVENNYASGVSQYDAFPEQFLMQRADAYQAFYENLPLRHISKPEGSDMRLYRQFKFGKLAEFNVLDTRQYRDDYTTVMVSGPDIAEREDPERTILGEEQEQWLLNNLKQSTATWNVLAQQVVMAQVDRNPGPGEEYSMDGWDGFVANRQRVLNALKQFQVNNPIVLTGDIHRHAAADLKLNFDDPDSEIIGSEFVTTSISSNGDGSELDDLAGLWLSNAHVKLYNGQRGYMRCHVTPDQWKTDHLVLPYITRKGAPIHTYASFIVENGKPGMKKVKQKSAQETARL